MKQYIYLSLILMAGLLAGCSDEILITDPTVPAISGDYYFVLSGVNSQTRAITYDDDYHSVFSEGDVLGAFAINEAGSGNLYSTGLASNESNNNVQYKVKNVSGGQVLVPVDESKKLPERSSNIAYVFYYPYQKNFTLGDNATNMTDFVYKIQANQNSSDGEAEHKCKNYENSDLLWDVVSPTTGDDNISRVHVEMDHMMANIILKIPSELIKEGSDVKILNRLLTVSAQNQLQATSLKLYNGARSDDGTLNKITYSSGTAWVNGTEQTGETSDITMWKYDTDEEGVSTYRAVMLASNDNTGKIQKYGEWNKNYLFEITTADGSTKCYGVKNDITLHNGKNYIFQVTSGSDEPLIPIPSDDDSWVLDVYNKKGDIVGLLCREYLRYQPSDDDDYPTGVQTTDGSSRYINSQAWVLYELKECNGKTVPDLKTGKVLRFIYDVAYSTNSGKPTKYGNTQADGSNNEMYWPLPNLHQRNGAFAADHGHYWARYADGVENGWIDGNMYGASSSKEVEYYMHGGTVQWGYLNKTAQISGENIIGITGFTMPEMQISNSTAKLYGHITWSDDGSTYGKVDISYDAKDRNSCKLVPHNLVDTRKVDNTDVITNYPLVKIGYNQFWMSKSFGGTTLLDGTSLECFNNTDENLTSTKSSGITEDLESKSVAFYSGVLKDDYGNIKGPDLTTAKAGYMYPFRYFSDTEIYNPAYYAKHPDAGIDQMNYYEDGKLIFHATPIYNKGAIDSEGFVPISNSTFWNMEYTLPGINGFEKLIAYYSFDSYAKFLTSHIGVKKSGTFVNSAYEDMWRGDIHDDTYDAYTANLSGFNFRVRSYYLGSLSGFGQSGMGYGCLMMNSKTSNDKVYILTNNPSDCFVTDPYNTGEGGLKDGNYNKVSSNSVNVNAYFGDVRFVMHFLGNELTSDSSTSAKTRATDSTKKKRSEDVYITLE